MSAVLTLTRNISASRALSSESPSFNLFNAIRERGLMWVSVISCHSNAAFDLDHPRLPNWSCSSGVNTLRFIWLFWIAWSSLNQDIMYKYNSFRYFLYYHVLVLGQDRCDFFGVSYKFSLFLLSTRTHFSTTHTYIVCLSCTKYPVLWWIYSLRSPYSIFLVPFFIRCIGWWLASFHALYRPNLPTRSCLGTRLTVPSLPLLAEWKIN